MSPHPEFLALAERCGARLTGKHDGSESISIVFTIDAWHRFDAVLASDTVELDRARADAVLYAGMQIWASIQRHAGDPCWEYASSDTGYREEIRI